MQTLIDRRCGRTVWPPTMRLTGLREELELVARGRPAVELLDDRVRAALLQTAFRG